MTDHNNTGDSGKGGDIGASFAASMKGLLAPMTTGKAPVDKPEASRGVIEATIEGMIEASGFPTGQRWFQKRLVRALLRTAAKLELRMGYNKIDYLNTAAKAVLDVEREFATEQVMNIALNPGDEA